VIDVLSDLFILRGIPGHIRSDNAPEFVAKAVREWITAVGVKTAYIEPGSPMPPNRGVTLGGQMASPFPNTEPAWGLRVYLILMGCAADHQTVIQHHKVPAIASLVSLSCSCLHVGPERVDVASA
jgi:putative transposase